MALIKLSPEQIVQYGTEIAGMQNQAQALLDNIKSHVNTMCGVWQGAANSAYMAQYNELAKNIASLPEIMMGIGEKAKAGGQAMLDLENSLRQAMSTNG